MVDHRVTRRVRALQLAGCGVLPSKRSAARRQGAEHVSSSWDCGMEKLRLLGERFTAIPHAVGVHPLRLL